MYDLSNVLLTLLLVAILFRISVIDIRRGIIPDKLNAALAALGVVASWLSIGRCIFNTVVGAVVVVLIAYAIAKGYFFFRQRNGLGLGDIKFLGAAACWVEVQYVPWLVLIASISGLCYVLLSKKVAAGSDPCVSIPFGPHLSLGLVVLWLVK